MAVSQRQRDSTATQSAQSRCEAPPLECSSWSSSFSMRQTGSSIFFRCDAVPTVRSLLEMAALAGPRSPSPSSLSWLAVRHWLCAGMSPLAATLLHVFNPWTGSFSMRLQKWSLALLRCDGIWLLWALVKMQSHRWCALLSALPGCGLGGHGTSTLVLHPHL